MWPSGQPTAPDGSWTATMLSPVARTSAAVSTPGTAGTGGGACVAGPAVAGAGGAGPTWAGFSRTGMRTLQAARAAASSGVPAAGVPVAGVPVAGVPVAGAARRDGLARVEHQALADERVQRTFRHPGRGRALHDVPHQQPVVGARQRVIVVAHPDRALEPPVGRVQTVRVVVAAYRQPRPPELGLQLGPGVDADVAAGDVVIVIRQPPAD